MQPRWTEWSHPPAYSHLGHTKCPLGPVVGITGRSQPPLCPACSNQALGSRWGPDIRRWIPGHLPALPPHSPSSPGLNPEKPGGLQPGPALRPPQVGVWVSEQQTEEGLQQIHGQGESLGRMWSQFSFTERTLPTPGCIFWKSEQGWLWASLSPSL